MQTQRGKSSCRLLHIVVRSFDLQSFNAAHEFFLPFFSLSKLNWCHACVSLNVRQDGFTV